MERNLDTVLKCFLYEEIGSHIYEKGLSDYSVRELGTVSLEWISETPLYDVCLNHTKSYVKHAGGSVMAWTCSSC